MDGHEPQPQLLDFTAALCALLTRPAAIAPEWVDPYLARINAGERVEVAAPGARPVRSSGGTAVIPITGPIQYRSDLWSMFGITTAVEDLQKALRSALADEAVKSIVLDIDSPGGSVDGVDEFAAEIRGAREVKPITAVANTWAASAAYYIAAQASEVVVTPSGEAGSIGVILVHADYSKMLEAEGITPTIIRTPARKAEANPYEPLTSDAREHLQSQVDEYYGMFVDAVAAGRRVPASKVRADFGGGRMLLAREAVRLGLADRVATLDTVLGRHSGTAARTARAEDDAQITTEGDTSEHPVMHAPSTEALYALSRSR